MKSLGVYIHIPVCESLCGYCDFYSVKKNQLPADFWQSYLQKLQEEFHFKSDYIEKDTRVNSIYFGGGTPSIAPIWFLNALTSFLFKNLPFSLHKPEISIEANPETITTEVLNQFAEIQINRLSIGVQSLTDRVLNGLDRVGSNHTLMQILGEIANGPIENWNADMMYGIPGQTVGDLIHTMQTLISYNPHHISAYELTLHTSGQNKIPEELQIEHQEVVWDYLPAHGYRQYEISNFARPGFECLHNLSVWKYRPYLSLGTSGHSFLSGMRFRTVADIERYLRDPVSQIIFSEPAQLIPDLFITTLRLGLCQGNALFKRLLPREKYSLWLSMLSEFSEKGWIEVIPEGFRIKRDGLNFSNLMLEAVIDNLA